MISSIIGSMERKLTKAEINAIGLHLNIPDFGDQVSSLVKSIKTISKNLKGNEEFVHDLRTIVQACDDFVWSRRRMYGLGEDVVEMLVQCMGNIVLMKLMKYFGDDKMTSRLMNHRVFNVTRDIMNALGVTTLPSSGEHSKVQTGIETVINTAEKRLGRWVGKEPALHLRPIARMCQLFLQKNIDSMDKEQKNANSKQRIKHEKDRQKIKDLVMFFGYIVVQDFMETFYEFHQT